MRAVPGFQVYLFDLDGTLVDSASDICGAIREVLAATPEDPAASDEFLRSYIGLHLIDLFRDIGFAEDRVEPLIAQYRKIYPGRGHASTRVFPGVREGLAALGGKKSTATTKGTPTTRLMLELFGLLPFFDHVQGTDGFPAKPQPDVIFKSLEALGARPEDCLLVGDSPADMEAGRRAGVRTCAVRYGYGSAEGLAKWEPDYWVDDLRELGAG